jgi:hypothetical protein
MNVVTELNQEFAAVLIGGKFRVYNGRNFLGVDDFKNLIADRTVKAGDKIVPMSGIWLRSPDRRTYLDVVFDPDENSPDILNLYRGFAIKPAKGRWSLFEEHIFENICGGRKDYYEWLIQWMAQIVQEPAKKLGTAVVVRGKKGTGKGIFAETFGELFGEYFTELSSGQHVTSQFNSVYEHSLLLCADEAIWAGDKKGEGTLKNLITAPKIYIIHKGFEGAFKKNFTRFIFTTNADWAVPATQDERRFFVLDIGTGWQKNLKMFAAMLAQMDNGGYEAMMFDLLKIKLTVNLRIPPGTKGLQEQIIRSEPLFIQFWREKVSAADPEVWPNKIRKDTLYNEMIDYCNKRKARHIVGSIQFFKALRQYIEPWKEIRAVDVINPASGRTRYIILPEHKDCVRLLK